MGFVTIDWRYDEIYHRKTLIFMLCVRVGIHQIDAVSQEIIV